ncbi:hypothetical protein NM688_g5257 [Phlebia brevispora]|uniref:Uncharacterized protein n=1 Tax=Phlebia brevispora TaxID=194682 RepID=A0ACC1SYD4_9APHY|nr:hypothetical protein NM688_g5257 [Phlebia brevispora]
MSTPIPVPRPPIAPPIRMPTIPPLSPTHDQVPILYVIVVYAVVIFALWNVPGARNLINPLKLFTIGWHELCHIAAAILTGGTVMRVCIDPDLGGATHVQGGMPTVILCAGYLGSTFFGGVLVMSGFDTLVAKIMSFIVGIGLLCPLVLVRDKLTILLTFCYEGLLIGFWFIDHGQALRWYTLFLGVMSVLYVIWDVADDKFFRKANDSDAAQFNMLYPSMGAHLWAIFWISFQVAILTGFVLLGIACFKLTPAQMASQAAEFLPTR